MLDKIQTALNTVKGSTIASIEINTPVAVSASNRDNGIVITKTSKGSVMLFNNINDTTDPYLNKVLKTSGADEFVKTATYFHHLDTFSLCKHNTKEEYYLSLIWNKSTAQYFINGKLADRQQVASYQTASEAKKTLDDSGIVYNKTNDIEHKAIFRVVKLDNIISLSVNGSILTA